MTINNTGIKRILSKLLSKFSLKDHTHQVFITNPFNLTPGVETSLGDGTYIQRFTGNGTMVESTQINILVHSYPITQSTKIVDTGGSFRYSNQEMPFPMGLGDNFVCVSIGVVGASNECFISIKYWHSGPFTYDVWIRYVKV